MDYEDGELGYITRLVDRGFFNVSLSEYNNFSPFQVLAFKIIDLEIRKWRSKNKPLVVY
ncbi:hypothetical protein [Methanobrevibacter olleyae]|uniref:hypothetical protein n=1 Tax=Methanobrevibacter olleyae TaxID=294671 RepID=UPI000B0A8A23|nr:hypothetical protein [Methanobrevibacter olleyae]